MVARIVALIWLVGATSSVIAQEAFNNGLPQNDEGASSQAVAENAWIDLRQRPSAGSRPQSAPSWVEAVSMTSTTGTDGRPRAVFRIRVSRPSADYQIMFFRIFFDDKADARPEIVAWDELGTQVLRSGDLGSGVGLPSSDSVMIPMNGISTLDIEVPGEGKTVRAAYLDWMTSSEVVHPVNAEHRDVIPERDKGPSEPRHAEVVLVKGLPHRPAQRKERDEQNRRQRRRGEEPTGARLARVVRHTDVTHDCFRDATSSRTRVRSTSAFIARAASCSARSGGT